MREMLSLRRRHFLGLGATASLAAVVPPAYSDTGAPIKIMVGFAAGGSADQTARLVANAMQAELGRTLIVDNRTGAGGRIMMTAVKGAKPDGNTLMLVPHGPMTLFPHIYRRLGYDPVTDFTPIGRICTFDYSFATGPATSAKTMAEYLAWARDPAHRAAIGSPGAGTIPHLLGVALSESSKTALVHVPYRGAAPSVMDVIGGTLSMTVTPLADTAEHHRAGKVRVLATAGTQRTTVLEGVPTLKESGIDLALDGWYGLYAPAGLPAAQQEQLTRALRAAVPKVADALARTGLAAAVSTPQELARLQQTESPFWAQLVKASGFTPDD